MTPNRQIINDLNTQRELIASRTALRRKCKTIFKRLRNDQCSSCFLSPSGTPDETHIGTVFIYLRVVVKNMKKDVAALLERIDNLPMDGTWTSYDNDEGNRIFSYEGYHNKVKFYINVTAVVAADGVCRKVVTGERVETVRSPIYEIICPE